jgi:DNA-binding CsgD family transcriptional regulator
MGRNKMSQGGNGRSINLLKVLEDGDPAAFATDEDDRIVFWNSGAATLFGRSAGEALGRFCYSIIRGRDLSGNNFCYRDCPIVANRRIGEPASGCEVQVPSSSGETRTVSVTIIHIPGEDGDSPTSLHLLRPLDEAGPLADMLDRLNKEAAREPEGEPVPALTLRESEILRWVAVGLQNKEVAQKLGISLATVRNHIHNILDKLQVHSKLEAVSLAFRKGWVSGQPDDRGPLSMPGLPDATEQGEPDAGSGARQEKAGNDVSPVVAGATNPARPGSTPR